MLVFGSSIGEGNYTRPQGEVIYFEKILTSTNIYATGYSDVASTILNLEADSDGVIPKGAKAVYLGTTVNDSGSAATNTYLSFAAVDGEAQYQNKIHGHPDDINQIESMHVQPCDANGDVYYRIEASGSSTFDAYMNYMGVQLR